MLKRQVHPQIALTNDQPLLPLNVLKASCSHFLFASDNIIKLLEVKVGPFLNHQLLMPQSCYVLSNQAENSLLANSTLIWVFLIPSKAIYCITFDITM